MSNTPSDNNNGKSNPLFGNTLNNTSLFGGMNTNTNTNNNTPSIFGNNPTSSPSPNLSSMFGSVNPSNNPSIFGSNSGPSINTNSMFGNQNTTEAKGLFGAGNSASSSLFGKQKNNNQPSGQIQPPKLIFPGLTQDKNKANLFGYTINNGSDNAENKQKKRLQKYEEQPGQKKQSINSSLFGNNSNPSGNNPNSSLFSNNSGSSLLSNNSNPILFSPSPLFGQPKKQVPISIKSSMFSNNNNNNNSSLSLGLGSVNQNQGAKNQSNDSSLFKNQNIGSFNEVQQNRPNIFQQQQQQAFSKKEDKPQPLFQTNPTTLPQQSLFSGINTKPQRPAMSVFDSSNNINSNSNNGNQKNEEPIENINSATEATTVPKTNPLFGNKNQVKVQQKQKQKQPKIFGGFTPSSFLNAPTKTINTTLDFGKKVQQNKNQPKFSLTGKVSEEPNKTNPANSLFNAQNFSNISNVSNDKKSSQHQKLFSNNNTPALITNIGQKSQLSNPNFLNSSQINANPPKPKQMNSLFSTAKVQKVQKLLKIQQKSQIPQLNDLKQQLKQNELVQNINFTKQGSLFGNNFINNNSGQLLNSSKQSPTFGKGSSFSAFQKDTQINGSLFNLNTSINKQTKQGPERQNNIGQKQQISPLLPSFSSTSNLNFSTQPTSKLFTNSVSQSKKLQKSASNLMMQTQVKPSVQFLRGRQSQPQSQRQRESQKEEAIIFSGYQANKHLQQYYKNKSSAASNSNANSGLSHSLRKDIEPWILTSFTRKDSSKQNLKVVVQNLHTNGDVNKFLNDVSNQLLQFLNIQKNEKSVKLMNKTFLELLKQEKLTQCLIINGQLNNTYFLRHQIYSLGETAELNLQSSQLNIYLFGTIKYFTLSQLHYVRYMSICLQALKPPSKLFFSLLKYCLLYNKYKYTGAKHSSSQITSMIKEYQAKIVKQIITLLYKVFKNSKNIQIVNKNCLDQILLMLDNVHYQQENVIQLTLKVLLGIFDLKFQTDYKISQQSIKIIKQSKSLALLPFRTILPNVTGVKSKYTLPSSLDLFRYVNGTQWIDWLQIYLDSLQKERQVDINQSMCILNVLKTQEQFYGKLDQIQKNEKYFKPTYENQLLLSRVLQKKRPIYRFIMGLKQENHLDLFYQFLTKLIFNYQSFRKIDECFFKQCGQFTYELKNIIAEITNFPTMGIKQEIPFFQSKLLYFLKIIQIAPDKLQTLESGLFFSPLIKKGQMLPTLEEQSYQSIHKLCHFAIDTINYFSTRNNQYVVGKAIRCINSLLNNPQTHFTMKITMNINRPQIKFLEENTKILQSLADSLNQLLYLIVQNQSFADSLVLNIEDRSQRFYKLYPFRYSYRQYLPMLDHLVKGHQRQIQFSSYWIYKCLLTLTCQGPKANILNILLQKLMILPSVLDNQNRMINEQTSSSFVSQYNQTVSTQSIPKILLYIVNTINDIGIMDYIMKSISYEIKQVAFHEGSDENSRSNTKRSLKLINKKLQKQSKVQEIQLFLTLKLFKTLLNLYRVHQTYRERTDHFAIKLLSKLKCLNELEQFYFNPCQRLDSIMDKEENVNIIIGLIGLLQEKEDFFNVTINDEKQFLSSDKSNFQQVHKLYKEYSTIVNYQVLNNFLNFSNNKYLECYESLNTLIYDCLSLLINKQKGSTYIGIQKFTFGGSFQSSRQEKSKVSFWVIEQFCEKTINLLAKSKCNHTKESILKFVICCKKTAQNSSLGSKIFFDYVKRMGPSEKSIRINLLLAKILSQQLANKITYNKIPQNFLDNLLKNIINTLNVKEPSKLISQYLSKNFVDNLTSNEFQRFYDQRTLIDIGSSYETITYLIKILQIKFYQNQVKLQAFKNLITLISKFNLVLLSSTFDKNIQQPKNQLLIEYPRLFNEDTLSKFILQTSAITSDHKAKFYSLQSQNVVLWLSYQGRKANKIINKFIEFILTIDKSFYGNNPINIKTKQNKQIFCHQHLGSVKYSAIQLFGDSYNEAVSNVKSIYDTCLAKLENGLEENHVNCFHIMRYCIEWLNTQLLQGQKNMLSNLVKKSCRNMFWLNQNTLQHSQVNNYLMCLMSVGKNSIDQKVLCSIRNIVHTAVIKASSQSFYQVDSVCLQTLLTLLMETSSKTVQLSTVQVMEKLVSIWIKEANPIFFSNQSRVIVEYALQFPNQIAKLKPLTNCERLKKCSTSYQAYADKIRTPSNISWIWGLKVATSIMCSNYQSVPINQEIGSFILQNKLRIFNILTLNPQKIQFAYLEQLESTLQLLLAFTCSNTLITVHRTCFQELVYILTHRVISFFLDYIGGKKKFIPCSEMEIKLNQTCYEDQLLQTKEKKYDGFMNQYEIRQFNSSQNESAFYLAMEIKMIYCMRSFVMLTGKSLQQSYFVQKYFDFPVWQNYKYAMPFWDRLNKSFIDMIRFSLILIKRWNKIQKLDYKIQMLSDCFKSPQVFVESGYLTSISQYPKNKQNLYEQINLLRLMTFQLSKVHIIQQIKFRTKYNTLMKSHIEAFCSKLVYQSKQLKESQQEQNMQFEFVNRQDFSKMQEVFQTIMKAK